MTEKNLPVKEFRVPGAPGLKIAAWENPNGLSFQISKSYKAKDGSMKTSTTFFDSDIMGISFIAHDVLRFAAEYRLNKKLEGKNSERKESRSEPRAQRVEAETGTAEDDLPF